GKVTLVSDKNQLKLVPQDQWKMCERCHSPVPGFANLSDSLRQELERLVETSPVRAIHRLQQAGCPYEVAKTAIYHPNFCLQPCPPPFPLGENFFRPPKTKQGFFGGGFWH